MESLAALSLACNVVQIVDFAGKAIQIITEVHKDGQTSDNAAVERTTKHLRDLCEKVNTQCQSTTLNDVIRQTTKESMTVAEELIQELAKLRARGSTWTKLKTGMRAVKSRGKIEKLQQQLNDCEKQVNLSLLAKLMDQNEAVKFMQTNTFNKIDYTLQGFIVRLSQGQAQISDLIKSENQETKALVVQTKDAITSKLDSLELSERRTRIMNSLRHPEMNARFNQIDESSPGTWDPFFEPSSPLIFTKWFREGEGILWIQGKAGSGKSTLMKFIAESARVKDLISEGSERYALVHHFFWLTGTLPQRNLHGLLCGLAYQLTRLVEDIHQKDKLHIGDWSVKELEEYVLSLVKILASSRTVVILLDALDEYDEQCGQRKLLNIITKLSQHSRICVSSRPEVFWTRHLLYTSCINLEDITHNVIRTFVKHEFEIAGLVGSDKLCSELTVRAEGAFIWAFIAVKDVIGALDSCATGDELQKRLERLPKGMEQLCTHMLKRREEDLLLVQEEAAIFFSLAFICEPIAWPLTTDGQLRLYHFHAVFAYFLLQKPALDDLATLEEECQKLKNRINFVCAGMLQVHAVRHGQRDKRVFNATVQLHHRTVRDFLLETPYGRRLMRCDKWNAAAAICAMIDAGVLVRFHVLEGLVWSDIAQILTFARFVGFPDRLDEKGHLEVIQTIEKILIAAVTQTTRRSPDAIQFVHKERIFGPDHHNYYFSTDFLGLSLETGTTYYFRTLDLKTHRLSLQYMEYLLYCSLASSAMPFPFRGHVYLEILKIFKPYGVTGNANFWLKQDHPEGSEEELVTQSKANELLFHEILTFVQLGNAFQNSSEKLVTAALNEPENSSLNANNAYGCYISMRSSFIRHFAEHSEWKTHGDELYVEGNVQYWLSVAPFHIESAQLLQRLNKSGPSSVVVPLRRLRYISYDEGDKGRRVIPIFMCGQLTKSGEDGEILLQLWETSQKSHRNLAEFEQQDQEAMENEAKRLMQSVAPFLDRTTRKDIDNPEDHLGNRYSSISETEYFINEGIFRPRHEVSTHIPVYED